MFLILTKKNFHNHPSYQRRRNKERLRVNRANLKKHIISLKLNQDKDILKDCINLSESLNKTNRDFVTLRIKGHLKFILKRYGVKSYHYKYLTFKPENKLKKALFYYEALQVKETDNLKIRYIKCLVQSVMDSLLPLEVS